MMDVVNGGPRAIYRLRFLIGKILVNIKASFGNCQDHILFPELIG
jgi:hypothetical protein